MSTGLMAMAKQKRRLPVTGILNNQVITYTELNDIYHLILEKQSVEERKKIKGLDPKRADIIQSGIIIFRTILKALQVNEYNISGYSLREGIIIDTLQKKKEDNLQPKLRDIRFESIKHLAKISDFDQKHCQHVANLALQIFDQTVHIHGLHNEHREYLEAAALLHDIGYHIGHARHHIHSHYIIKNSELLGFNEKEKLIIANISRYHRKSHPKPSHDDFMTLSENSKDVVKKLASILRVADSLDRRHKENIRNISVSVTDTEIIFELSYTGEEPEVEIWNLGRRQGLMEEVFSKKLKIETICLDQGTNG